MYVHSFQSLHYNNRKVIKADISKHIEFNMNVYIRNENIHKHISNHLQVTTINFTFLNMTFHINSTFLHSYLIKQKKGHTYIIIKTVQNLSILEIMLKKKEKIYI